MEIKKNGGTIVVNCIFCRLILLALVLGLGVVRAGGAGPGKRVTIKAVLDSVGWAVRFIQCRVWSVRRPSKLSACVVGGIVSGCGVASADWSGSGARGDATSYNKWEV
jgi:hypothetical protein